MDIFEILQSLPADLAHTIRLRLEDCPVSTHLLEEEALEIITDVVRDISLIESLTTEQESLLWQIPEAVVSKIFN